MATKKKTATTEGPRKRTPRAQPVAAIPDTIPEDDEIVIPAVVEPITKTKYWMAAVLIAVGLILVTMLLWPDPKPQPPIPDDSAARTEMDSTAAVLKELRALQSQLAAEKVAEGEKNYKQPIINNHYYDKRKKEFDAIPARIDSATKSELRRLFAKP